MSVQLIAGGRTAESLQASRSADEVLREWRKAVKEMLELAVSIKPKKDRTDAMRRWIESHDAFDEKYDERQQQFHDERLEYCRLSGKLMDATVLVTYWQQRLPAEMVQSIGERIGRPIFPDVSQLWAIYSLNTGVSDVAEVTAAWMRDERQEREACPF